MARRITAAPKGKASKPAAGQAEVDLFTLKESLKRYEAIFQVAKKKKDPEMMLRVEKERAALIFKDRILAQKSGANSSLGPSVDITPLRSLFPDVQTDYDIVQCCAIEIAEGRIDRIKKP